MPLREEFESQGNWLFRWRSYLPLALVLMIVQASLDFDYPRGRHALQEAWMVCCLGVSLLGLAIRMHVAGHTPKGTSGRTTRRPTSKILNSDGFYSVVRHPLYFANFLIWLGIALFFHQLWLTIAFCAVFWLYYERIMYAEEEYLRRQFGEEFTAWANRTPAFVPYFGGWRAPRLPISWRKVARREYTTVFAIAVAYGGLEFAEHLIVEGRLEVEPHWQFILPGAVALYAAARFVKHRIGKQAPLSA